MLLYSQYCYADFIVLSLCFALAVGCWALGGELANRYKDKSDHDIQVQICADSS
jgi:hypothetical protein